MSELDGKAYVFACESNKRDSSGRGIIKHRICQPWRTDHRWTRGCYNAPEAAQKVADQLNQMRELESYHQLHDGISDMIEAGRLTSKDIPRGLTWLVETLTRIAGTGILNV